jgi:hypothetical protein
MNMQSVVSSARIDRSTMLIVGFGAIDRDQLWRELKLFMKKHKIHGRINPIVQIEPAAMQVRHDELAIEMESRGGKHKSPYTLPDLSYLSDDQRYEKADIRYNIVDLCKRCADCRQRILSSLKKGA